MRSRHSTVTSWLLPGSIVLALAFLVQGASSGFAKPVWGNDAPLATNTPTPQVPTSTFTGTPAGTATRTPTPCPTCPTATPTATPPCTGSWQSVNNPDPPGISSGLAGIAIAAPIDIWAVGSNFVDTNIIVTLVKHWDGSQWSIVQSPNVSNAHNLLSGVSVVDPNDVWAAGYSDNGTNHPLIEHWDGNEWSIIPSPDVTNRMLYSVSAVASNDVWVAGTGGLVEHWDGSQWSVVPTGIAGDLRTITALSANDIWAVGGTSITNGQNVAIHWDGTQWSLVPTPNVGTGLNELNGVSGIASNDVWAVGSYQSSSALYRTLMLHWDGSSWNVVPSPNYGDQDNNPFAVVAIATNDVWATGEYFGPGGNYSPLALHWDGTAWSLVTVGGNSGLEAIAAVNGTNIWAAGYHWDPNSSYSLIEHYTNPCVSSTPTITGTPPTATNTRTATPTRSITPTRTVTSTATVTPTRTNTLTPTNTPTATNTVTGTPPTATNTSPPTVTVTPTSGLFCYASGSIGTTACSNPANGIYTYTATLQGFCSECVLYVGLYYTATLLVAPDESSTFTPYYQAPARYVSFGCGGGTINATEALTAGAILPPNHVYKVRLDYQSSWGNHGYTYSAVEPICDVLTATPTSTVTPTLPTQASPSATATPTCQPWVERAPYPTADFSLMATSLGGEVYAFGGRDANYVRLASAYKYRPPNNDWVQLASMPQICFWCSAVTVNGNIYIVNGSHDMGPANDSSIYNPVTNTWSAGPDGLVATYGQSALYMGNVLYRIGGIEAGGYSTTVEDYGHSLLAPLPDGVAWAQAVAIPPYIYLAGGSTYGGIVNKTYRYDPATNTWDDNVIADMPEPRAWAAGGLAGGKWIIAGGIGTEDSAVSWDPQTNTWSHIAPPLDPRSDMAAATISGTQLYLVGGLTSTRDAVTSNVEEYNPATCATGTATRTATRTPASTSTSTRTPSTTPIGTPLPGCDGTWQFVPISMSSYWTDVDAVSSTDVWIAGANKLAHWNGAAWSDVQVPLPPGEEAYNLQSVTGGSSNDIWVVGSYELGGFYPLILHWNGVQFDIVSWPSTIYGPVYSATTIGPGEIMAVGALRSNFLPSALRCTAGGCVSVLLAEDGYFYGIWANASDDVWAVGYDGNGHSLSQHFDGTQWHTVATPDIGHLFGVSGVAGDDVWAVGDGGALHWDGTAWGQVAGPTNLYDVAALASNDAWAVGQHIWHWDGTRWTQVHPGASIALYGVSARTPRDIWAVSNGGQVMRYTAQVFEDVPPDHTFYDYIGNLACRGIINGYTCGGPGEPCVPPGMRPYFRSGNNVTRGQVAKIVSQSAGFSEPVTGRFFQDVPPGSTFYTYTQRLTSRQIMSGYPCGGPGEPCVPPANLPYFRTNNNATRGQISKIDSNAAGFNDPQTVQMFQDIPVGSTFYTFTARLASRGIMAGYQCGGSGEPCLPPANLPYFRPNNNATRGQTSKIVANTFFPDYRFRGDIKR